MLGGRNIAEVTALTVAEAHAFFAELDLKGADAKIAAELLKEIRSRLAFLLDVGLDYLTLDRAAPTLSGGESQRIRLASQIGSELSGVMYVLDEPSIGLHQRDNRQLIATLKHLRDLGNTVIVVEHDAETIEAADCLVDFGPGRGPPGRRDRRRGHARGGHGARSDSLTGRYLAGRPARSRCPPSGAGRRQQITVGGRAREQPQGRRRRLPARRLDLRHRRLGRGQELAHQRDPLPGAGARRFTAATARWALTTGSPA